MKNSVLLFAILFASSANAASKRQKVPSGYITNSAFDLKAMTGPVYNAAGELECYSAKSGGELSQFCTITIGDAGKVMSEEDSKGLIESLDIQKEEFNFTAKFDVHVIQREVPPYDIRESAYVFDVEFDEIFDN